MKKYDNIRDVFQDEILKKMHPREEIATMLSLKYRISNVHHFIKNNKVDFGNYSYEELMDIIYKEDCNGMENKYWKNDMIKVVKELLMKCTYKRLKRVYKKMWNKKRIPKKKQYIADEISCCLFGNTRTMTKGIKNRKIELSNVHMVDEYRIFYFFNGKLSLPKEMILEILSFYDFTINREKKIVNHHYAKPGDDRNTFLLDLMNRCGMINLSWYFVVLEAIGRYQYININQYNVYKIPIVVLRQLIVPIIDLKDIYLKDIKFIQKNLPNSKHIYLDSIDDYISFFNVLRGNHEGDVFKYLESITFINTYECFYKEIAFEVLWLQIPKHLTRLSNAFIDKSVQRIDIAFCKDHESKIIHKKKTDLSIEYPSVTLIQETS